VNREKHLLRLVVGQFGSCTIGQSSRSPAFSPAGEGSGAD